MKRLARWAASSLHRRPFLMPALAAVIFAAGFAVRMRLYLSGRSLWHDEAMLAVNVVQRSFLGLFPPLEFRQVTPVGFLMLVKVLFSLLGNTEYVLRLIPLLAGLAAMPLTLLLARRWGRGAVPLLSLTLVALAPTLVYYSSEFKQYSTDVVAALVLLVAGASCLAEDGRTGALWRLGVAGLVLSWISHPALFVLGGVLLTVGLSCALRRDWTRFRIVLAIGLLLALNVGLLYYTSMRDSVEDRGHVDFWAGSFPPALSSGSLDWYRGAFALLIDPLISPSVTLVAVLFLGGLISLARRRWEWLSLVVIPTLLMFLASFLRLYPIADRLLLFTVPAVLLATAEGIELTRQLLTRRSTLVANLVASALAVFLMYAPLRADFKIVRAPPLRDHITPALAYLRDHHLDSDVVYLYYFAIPQFEYYAPLYGLDHLARVDGVMSRDRPALYRQDVDRLEGTPRVWFVFVHNYREGRINEQQYFLQQLDLIGTRLEEFYSTGTTVLLYDLDAVPGG